MFIKFYLLIKDQFSGIQILRFLIVSFGLKIVNIWHSVQLADLNIHFVPIVVNPFVKDE